MRLNWILNRTSLLDKAVLALGIIAAVFFHHAWLSTIAVLMACSIVFGPWLFGEVPEPVIAHEPTPLDRLRELLTTQDAITKVLEKIQTFGESLLAFQNENAMTTEVLKAYTEHIKGYVESAASLGRKYRRAAMYTDEKAQTLQKDIQAMQVDIKSGKKGLENTLQEKESTLQRFGKILQSKQMIEKSLGEISATLESLQAAVTSADLQEGTREQIMGQVQLKFSTLGQALDQTFQSLKEQDVFSGVQPTA